MAPAVRSCAAGGPELPPNYDTFQPPAVGGTYVDPVFGSTVKRISNALGTPNADGGGNLTWITDEYSTMSPFNSDNSKILLVHQSYFGLYDGTGFYIRDLPLEINSSSEPRWSRKDNHTIYYVRGNQLKTYDISSGAMNIVAHLQRILRHQRHGRIRHLFRWGPLCLRRRRPVRFRVPDQLRHEVPGFDTGGSSSRQRVYHTQE